MLRQQNRLRRCYQKLIAQHLSQCQLDCVRSASSLLPVQLAQLQCTSQAPLHMLGTTTASHNTLFVPQLHVYNWHKTSNSLSVHERSNQQTSTSPRLSASDTCGLASSSGLLAHHCHFTPIAPLTQSASASQFWHLPASNAQQHNDSVLRFTPASSSDLKWSAVAIGRRRARDNGKGSSYSTDSSGNGNRPNHAQLNHIVLRLTDYVPDFFQAYSPDLTIYRENIEFDDRIFHRRSIGLDSYWRHLGMLKNLGRVTAAAVEMQIVSIWPGIDDGTVRLRWRVVHLPVYQIHKMWGVPRGDAAAASKRLNKHGRWYDGYSVFYVDGEGMVYKHVMDRVMPDGSRLKGETQAQRLARRLLGVAPAPK